MDGIEIFLLVVIVILAVGTAGYAIYLFCLRIKYTKQLSDELGTLPRAELEDVVQRIGYLLNTHGDLLSAASRLYYQIRYDLAKKMLSDLKRRVNELDFRK